MNDALRYSMTDCDVPPERRAALEAYRTKRHTWLEWIDNDADHAIWTTLSAMVWNGVSFRTLAHLGANDQNSPLTNSLVAEKLINGHVATQVLAIRRLMDRTRNTISLRNLISDIRRNYPLFTRENYVCHDGLPYDYEPVMHAEIARHANKGPFWGATSGPQAWGTSQIAHQQFDRLAGIAPENRKREDRLPRALLDRIEGWLNDSGADEQTKWSHAYLAHAGSAESRKALAEAIITNDRITATTRVLARATEAVSAYLLFAGGRSNALMPTAQFDQLEHLDRPIIQPNQRQGLHDLWDGLTDERDQFLEGVREELETFRAFRRPIGRLGDSDRVGTFRALGSTRGSPHLLQKRTRFDQTRRQRTVATWPIRCS
jgi:hypothetical protein